MKFFKAIHDEHRQKMMDLLHEKGKMNVGDIVKKVKLSQPTVSHHLKILSEAEVIVSKKEGKEVFYELSGKMIQDCCMGFWEHFKHKKKSSK
jgi:DNA-binding transcriptional ArsR family regulator